MLLCNNCSVFKKSFFLPNIFSLLQSTKVVLINHMWFHFVICQDWTTVKLFTVSFCFAPELSLHEIFKLSSQKHSHCLKGVMQKRKLHSKLRFALHAPICSDFYMLYGEEVRCLKKAFNVSPNQKNVFLLNQICYKILLK